ncbi:MAG: VTT domain-containing protein [Phycisphaerae bacterium]|nr:VTT domain-containing protein [Phycisphaerae bacterium]
MPRRSLLIAYALLAVVLMLAATAWAGSQEAGTTINLPETTASAVTHAPDEGWMRELGKQLVKYGPLSIFVAFVISGVGLHLSEDFILIPAGIFAYEQYVATGHWNWFLEASFAAWLGIIVGDAGWIWICRHFGGKLLGWRTFRRLIGPRTLLEVKFEMDKRGAWALFIARFIPGLRTPMVTMAGLMQLSWWRIMLVEAVGVMITAPLQIGIGVGVARLGEQFENDAHRWMLYIAATLAVAGLMFAVHVLIQRRRSAHRPPRAPMRWLSGFSRAALAQRTRRTKTEAFGQPG